MAILDLMGAAAGGGLFGVLGTVAGRVAQYFETKQSQAHEKARWAHEVKLLAMQQDRQLAEQEHALEVLETEGRWQGLTASLEADARVGKSYLWVNAVRALTRPF